MLNPRRDDWDSTWENSIINKLFYEQVSWEITALEVAEVIIMHFSSKSVSPVTLLELGLFARSNKLVVSCSPEYWRYGNVEVICKRFGIPLYTNLDDLLKDPKIKMKEII